jgi:hypothetical protein
MRGDRASIPLWNGSSGESGRSHAGPGASASRRHWTSWLRICGVGRGYSAFAKRPRCWSCSLVGSGCGYGQLFGASGKHHGVVERHWLRCESQGSCATRPVAALALGLSHGAKPFASGSPMPTSNRSAFHLCLERVSATSRTAVYGPVRTVVWEGRSREAPPIPIPSRSAMARDFDFPRQHCRRARKRRIKPPEAATGS